MIELARARVGGGTFFVADLGQPLEVLASASCDVVVSSLALDYVRDWTCPLREFRRVLVDRGRLVFSVQHPMAAFEWYRLESAFGVQYVEGVWKSFGPHVVVPDHYRGFEEMVNPLLAAGFVLEKVIETRPVEALREVDPVEFEKYSRRPSFLCFAATRSA